jgi:hypothetical protein
MSDQTRMWHEMNQKERLDATAVLTDKGLSCRAIAEALGTTRGTIAGTWRRHPDLFKRDDKDWQQAQLAAQARGLAKKRHTPITLAAIAEVVDLSEGMTMIVESDQIDEREPRTIVTVRDGECRWMLPRVIKGTPVHELFVCGAPVDPAGGAWCTEHRKRVMAPPDTRRLPLKAILRGVKL